MSAYANVDFIVAIPARMASTRLPGKPLATIAGQPMIVHVARRALGAGAREVVVATDDTRIVEALAMSGVAVNTPTFIDASTARGAKSAATPSSM